MSHSVRHLLTAAATAATFAIAAPMAGAEQVTVPNACGADGQYGDLPLKLSATGAVNGRSFDVSAIQPSVDVPAWLPEKLKPAALILGAGTHNVAVDSWMAVAGAGSADAPKVLTSSGTVTVVVTGNILQGFTITSVSLTLGASAATSWAAPAAGGTVSVGQAPAGSLPAIPAGAGNAPITPKGSLYIRGVVKTGLGSTTLLIDCQPGSTGGDGQSLTTSFTPGTAAPLVVSSPFAAGAPTPAPTTPTGPPALAIASPKLKFGSAAVLVNVACPAGAAPCTGKITLTSAKKLKVGKGKAKVRALGAANYSVPAGTTAPVKVKLSADGKKLRKKALVATITLKPSSGAAVKKNLRAN
ncbi:MAG: hypothetical protein J7513_11135 [Solirubrobacteraceae bacterium]|nr:hypothetical protein [Solirubrobacteraceae bacterium]